jgi:hypothetical protein
MNPTVSRDTIVQEITSFVRVDLEEINSVTTVRLTHSGLTTEGSRNSHRGWAPVIALLQAHVEQPS